MTRTLVGTCSWTDKPLIQSRKFYPRGATSADQRLWYYASQFPIVEVDSPYYALPAPRNAELWVERTPDDFTFDIKAFGLFTTHPVQPTRFPRDLKERLPDSVLAKRNVYAKDVPPEIVGEAWQRYNEAVRPLAESGKLGVVTFQFPPWFLPGQDSERYIVDCQERMPGWAMAVEFRNRRWLEGEQIERTLGFLKDRHISYVCVDEPQGFQSSVPPIVEATAAIAIVRFHGRNSGTWERRGGTSADRFDYYYERDELEEWAPAIRQLAERAEETHLLANTNNYDQGPVNARLLQQVLLENQIDVVGPQPREP
ncbi:MAG: DUF72 domain-containing protein [Chloroflexota bacterium]